jgi:hypothetical protein
MRIVLIIWIFLFIPMSVFAGRGCCSWHGGVDYCAANGRYVCKDGTYSPSCTCNLSSSSNYFVYMSESNQKVTNISYTDNKRFDGNVCVVS